MHDVDETRARPTSKLDSAWRVWLRRLFALGVLSVVTGVGSLAGLYWWFVLHTEAPHLEREHILSVIAQESPVYYADGNTKIGVFFSEEHRQYVPAAELPEHFVHALVSAEDRNFYEHFGFSPKGITRAMVQNLRAGRTVAGGSTLTQQTAKNLFERRGRTYREKLRELANALRLERAYTKAEILEFYSNQFYVNGNGRGLGIAARFFFDAEVAELDLLQCAFLAGVVKSPNRYNPFVSDEERRARAISRAEERVEYVLRRMLEDGWIDAPTYEREVARDIPFRRGRFRFERSVVLDFVEQELESDEFRATLLAHGVEDPGRAGLQIVTTLDPDVQRETLYALRHHVSDAALWLETPALETLFGEPRDLTPIEREGVAPYTFHTGLLGEADPVAQTIQVSLGGDVVGVLDRAAHQRLATALLRGEKKNTWVEARRADRRALVERIAALGGRSVSVSVRGVDEDGVILLDYEPRVELDGATVVLDDGEVRAMVGGWGNVDFNRAVSAKRQLGSIWKLVLFEAALQLGWSPTDPLDNRRGVFPYQGSFYFPRPDHTGAPDIVSMGWAAARSENLATIWLLDHLSDPLTVPQFRALAARVGLVPGKGESRKEWVARVQKAGVVPTEARLVDGMFPLVWRDEITPDLLFEGREDDIRLGRSLHYGLGFAAEREVVEGDPGLGPKERAARLQALDRTFLRQEELAGKFLTRREDLLRRWERGRQVTDRMLEGFWVREVEERVDVVFSDAAPDGFRALTRVALDRLLAQEASGELGDEPRPAAQSVGDSVWDDIAPAEPRTKGTKRVKGARLAPAPIADAKPEIAEPPTRVKGDRRAHLKRIAEPEAVVVGSLEDLLGLDRVRLDGVLTPELVTRTRDAMERSRTQLGEDLDLYDFGMLARTRDFRLLVHLTYLASLAERSGVRSAVTPVMSMPLGSSDITLLEAALLYQAMVTGRTHQFYADALTTAPVARRASSREAGGEPRRDEISVVREVRLADGTVIYRTARETSPLHGPGVAAELQGMLGAVVTHGTGRRAAGGAPLSSDDEQRAADLARRKAVLPLFGKTGTTNSYKNSAFVGFVPDLGAIAGKAPATEHLRWGQGVVVATYVGYDDNREMRNGGVRLAGASGSLPAWLGAARAVAHHGDVGDRVDLVDLDFSSTGTLPITWPQEVESVDVDASTGLPLDGEGADAVAQLLRRIAGGAFEPIAVRSR